MTKTTFRSGVVTMVAIMASVVSGTTISFAQGYDYYTQNRPTPPQDTTQSAGNTNTDQSAGNPNTGQSAGNPNTGQSAGNPNTGQSASNPSGQIFYLQNPLSDKFTTVGGLVEGFLEIFSYIAVLFAVLMLIWVGLQFVLARGNVERLKELKTWLLYIIVGVAIVIGARIIVTVVINTLQATGTVSPTVITNAKNALPGN